WVAQCSAHLQTYELGLSWSSAISLWLKLEHILGYPDSSIQSNWLSSAKRPAEVGYWNKCGRPLWHILTNVGSTSAYAAAWKAWWTSMQPSWRISKGKWNPCHNDSHSDEEWTALRRGGKNGIFMVLVSLACW
ncbi:hypothetical protein BV22DRAFT_991336, partial [Leucogyrophana mollusca]